jgi:hypothetical protein
MQCAGVLSDRNVENSIGIYCGLAALGWALLAALAGLDTAGLIVAGLDIAGLVAAARRKRCHHYTNKKQCDNFLYWPFHFDSPPNIFYCVYNKQQNG